MTSEIARQTMLQNNSIASVNNPASMAMLQMIAGLWVSQLIYVAAKLGIADLVRDNPQTASELAASTGTHAPSLYRILRTLASVGVFAEDESGRFALTPLAATLQSNVPGSLRAFALSTLAPNSNIVWGNLMHSVKTGEFAFERAMGIGLWEYFEQHPEDAQIFNEAMTDMSAIISAAVLDSYDFSSISKLVDVGGGQGRLLASILKANSTMKGILFDMPSVVEGANQHLAAEGISDAFGGARSAHRCDIIGGDFFESVPTGGDAYILRAIVHAWDDNDAVAILKNCHRAMADNGKLLIIEAVIPPKNEPNFGKLMDINMLVMTGGRERTEAEFRELLKAAGFQMTRVIPTQSQVSIIESVKA